MSASSSASTFIIMGSTLYAIVHIIVDEQLLLGSKQTGLRCVYLFKDKYQQTIATRKWAQSKSVYMSSFGIVNALKVNHTLLFISLYSGNNS